MSPFVRFSMRVYDDSKYFPQFQNKESVFIFYTVCCRSIVAYRWIHIYISQHLYHTKERRRRKYSKLSHGFINTAIIFFHERQLSILFTCYYRDIAFYEYRYFVGCYMYIWEKKFCKQVSSKFLKHAKSDTSAVRRKSLKLKAVMSLPFTVTTIYK